MTDFRCCKRCKSIVGTMVLFVLKIPRMPNPNYKRYRGCVSKHGYVQQTTCNYREQFSQHYQTANNSGNFRKLCIFKQCLALCLCHLVLFVGIQWPQDACPYRNYVPFSCLKVMFIRLKCRFRASLPREGPFCGPSLEVRAFPSSISDTRMHNPRKPKHDVTLDVESGILVWQTQSRCAISHYLVANRKMFL